MPGDEFLWNDRNVAHIARHNVRPIEVEQVWRATRLLVRQGREGVALALGTTDSGRYLFLVISEADDGRKYCVTARDMTMTERREFRNGKR